MNNVITILILLLAFTGHGVELRFGWKANTEPDLAGYKLYHGPSSRQYTNAVILPITTNCSFTANGRQFFALSAFTASNAESDLTAELVYDPPMAKLVSERSLDGVLWEPAGTNLIYTIYPIEFYRLRIERMVP